jgi:hypothetical protein
MRAVERRARAERRGAAVAPAAMRKRAAPATAERRRQLAAATGPRLHALPAAVLDGLAGFLSLDSLKRLACTSGGAGGAGAWARRELEARVRAAGGVWHVYIFNDHDARATHTKTLRGGGAAPAAMRDRPLCHHQFVGPPSRPMWRSEAAWARLSESARYRETAMMAHQMMYSGERCGMDVGVRQRGAPVEIERAQVAAVSAAPALPYALRRTRCAMCRAEMDVEGAWLVSAEALQADWLAALGRRRAADQVRAYRAQTPWPFSATEMQHRFVAAEAQTVLHPSCVRVFVARDAVDRLPALVRDVASGALPFLSVCGGCMYHEEDGAQLMLELVMGRPRAPAGSLAATLAVLCRAIPTRLLHTSVTALLRGVHRASVAAAIDAALEAAMDDD